MRARARRAVAAVAVPILSVVLVAGPGASPSGGAGLPLVGTLVPIVVPILDPLLDPLGVDFGDLLDDAVDALPLPDLSLLPELADGPAPALALPAAGELPSLPNLGPTLPLPLLPDLDDVLPPALPLPEPVTLPGLPAGAVVPAIPSLGDLPLPLPAQLQALFVDATVDEVVAGATRTTTTRLVPFQPTTVDTDGNTADGAELLLLATLGTDGLTLRVERLPGAAAPYLAQVVGTLTDPTNGADRYSLGVDGRTSGVPRAVDIGAALAAGGGAVTVRTVEPAGDLTLVARLLESGVETVSARAGLAPVPATTVVSLAGERISIDTSEPTVLDLALVDGARTVTARVDRLPGSLAVERTATAGGETLALTASGRIATADIDLVEPGTVASLHLADVPTAVTLMRSPAVVRVDAPGRIGVVELELGDGTSTPAPLADPPTST